MRESARARARARVCVREICRMLKVIYACYVCMRERESARARTLECVYDTYVVALVSSIDKIAGLFCKRAL